VSISAGTAAIFKGGHFGRVAQTLVGNKPERLNYSAAARQRRNEDSQFKGRRGGAGKNQWQIFKTRKNVPKTGGQLLIDFSKLLQYLFNHEEGKGNR
jgi:hypothetical protein